MTLLGTLMPLQYGLFGLVALGAPAVVLSRDPLRMAVVNGLYGFVLVLLFVLLGAPDVALSMLVVTTVAYPVVLLIAIARSRSSKEDMEET